MSTSLVVSRWSLSAVSICVKVMLRIIDIVLRLEVRTERRTWTLYYSYYSKIKTAVIFFSDASYFYSCVVRGFYSLLTTDLVQNSRSFSSNGVANLVFIASIGLLDVSDRMIPSFVVIFFVQSTPQPE